MKKPIAYYEAIATLTGYVIGAGIFAIPYVVVRAGFWTGMSVIIGLGLVALLYHLMTGEIVLRSTKCHQLVGYAGKYLGKKGRFFMMVAMVIGIYGAMVAYTVGVSQSLSAMFGGSPWVWALIFYSVMAFLINGGIRVLEKSELWMEIFKFSAFIIILVILFSSKYFNAARFVGFTWDKLLLPYGVILFAFLGTSAIPEMRLEMKKCKLLTKRAIIIGSLIPLIVYALFTMAVVGTTGGAVTEVATIGLASLVGGFGFVLLHLFAILAMSSSFIGLGYAMKDTYRLDFRFSDLESWLLTMSVPVVLILLGITSFVKTLSIAGTFAGGIAGISIILMHMKARKRSERKPEYKINLNWIGYGALILLFSVGILYQLFLFL